MSSTTKTLEFSIPSIVPTQWFDDATRIWNEANYYLRWLQHYKRVQQCMAIDPSPLPNIEIKIRPHKWKDAKGKEQTDWVLYCDRMVQRRIDRTKSWEKGNDKLPHPVEVRQRVLL